MGLNQERVQQIRKRLGWSQKQMASVLGVPDPNMISQWEIGFRTPRGGVARLLLLLEKLRGKELQRLVRHLEKIGKEFTDAE